MTTARVYLFVRFRKVILSASLNEKVFVLSVHKVLNNVDRRQQHIFFFKVSVDYFKLIAVSVNSSSNIIIIFAHR